MEITWWGFSGEEEGKNGEGKVQGTRSIIDRHKIDGGRLSIVKETGKQRTYMYNHGHELKGGMVEGRGIQGREWDKGEKKNSIIA